MPNYLEEDSTNLVIYRLIGNSHMYVDATQLGKATLDLAFSLGESICQLGILIITIVSLCYDKVRTVCYVGP